MITNSAMQGGMVLYHPQIEIWSGTVRVRRNDDFGSVASELPPSEIVTDGRKRLIPTDPLKPMLNARKGVERMLKGIGFPFMGGIAVPEAKTGGIEAQLAEFEKAFNDGVDDLCRDLDHWYGKLQESHPAWEGILKASHITAAEVRKRCRFDVAAFQAAAPSQEAPEAVTKRFDRLAGKAFPELLKSLSERAASLLATAFKQREEVTQRQLTPVREIVEKLGSFSFIDPRVAPMADALAMQMRLLPLVGPLTKGQTSVLVSMLETLIDPTEMLETVEQTLGPSVTAVVVQDANEEILVPVLPVAREKKPAGPGYTLGF